MYLLSLYRPFARLPNPSYHMPFNHSSSLLKLQFSSLISPLLQEPNSMAACIDNTPQSCDPNRSQSHDFSFKTVKFCRPTFPEHGSCLPICHNGSETTTTLSTDKIIDGFDRNHDVWLEIREEAREDVKHEPILSNYYMTSILSHNSMESALSHHLSIRLSNSSLPIMTLYDLFSEILRNNQEIVRCVCYDLRAVRERDPACISYVQCFLNYKGFLACQAHRMAHILWSQGRKVLALLIQNRVSEAFAVDIHPGAKIGCGLLLDHATGVVVGETAVIGNNVSILHNVTLGGTGKDCGDRHPKIGDGVLIGAGTCILGNIKIGDGAKIGAGSVVLKDVPPRTTAVGNPARLVGGKENPIKLDKTPSFTMDHTSHISDWSDYVI